MWSDAAIDNVVLHSHQHALAEFTEVGKESRLPMDNACFPLREGGILLVILQLVVPHKQEAGL